MKYEKFDLAQFEDMYNQFRTMFDYAPETGIRWLGDPANDQKALALLEELDDYDEYLYQDLYEEGRYDWQSGPPEKAQPQVPDSVWNFLPPDRSKELLEKVNNPDDFTLHALCNRTLSLPRNEIDLGLALPPEEFLSWVVENARREIRKDECVEMAGYRAMAELLGYELVRDIVALFVRDPVKDALSSS